MFTSLPQSHTESLILVLLILLIPKSRTFPRRQFAHTQVGRVEGLHGSTDRRGEQPTVEGNALGGSAFAV